MDLNFNDKNQVASAEFVEALLDSTRTLLIFTGIPLVEFASSGDLDIHREQVRINLGRRVQRRPAESEFAAVVGLASIANTDSDFTFGTDGVDVEIKRDGELVLVVNIAVQGDTSHLSRFSFQLTVLVQERQAKLASILVSTFLPQLGSLGSTDPATFVFGPVQEIESGARWRYRITLDGPAQAPGVFVNLSSDRPDLAGVPVAIPIPVGETGGDFVGLAGASFTLQQVIDVHIKATLGPDSSTATLRVRAVPK